MKLPGTSPPNVKNTYSTPSPRRSLPPLPSTSPLTLPAFFVLIAGGPSGPALSPAVPPPVTSGPPATPCSPAPPGTATARWTYFTFTASFTRKHEAHRLPRRSSRRIPASRIDVRTRIGSPARAGLAEDDTGDGRRRVRRARRQTLVLLHTRGRDGLEPRGIARRDPTQQTRRDCLPPRRVRRMGQAIQISRTRLLPADLVTPSRARLPRRSPRPDLREPAHFRHGSWYSLQSQRPRGRARDGNDLGRGHRQFRAVLREGAGNAPSEGLVHHPARHDA